MTVVEQAAKVLRQEGFWGTHADRWNDEKWQHNYWHALANALNEAGLLIDPDQCKACGFTASACQEFKHGCCQNCTHGEAV